MPTYVVERVFSPPITEAQFMDAGKMLKPCIDERGITYLGSYLSSDGSRGVCMYEASDAERVREAQRTAGAPFERVWEAQKYAGAGV